MLNYFYGKYSSKRSGSRRSLRGLFIPVSVFLCITSSTLSLFSVTNSSYSSSSLLLYFFTWDEFLRQVAPSDDSTVTSLPCLSITWYNLSPNVGDNLLLGLLFFTDPTSPRSMRLSSANLASSTQAFSFCFHTRSLSAIFVSLSCRCSRQRILVRTSLKKTTAWLEYLRLLCVDYFDRPEDTYSTSCAKPFRQLGQFSQLSEDCDSVSLPLHQLVALWC